MTFELTLTGELDFSKCKRFSVRGFNQVKMYSLVSKEIKQCDAFNPKLINPKLQKQYVSFYMVIVSE
jgi:hypothetical protein